MVKLRTMDMMTDELANSLIGKHIHFTWHNKKDNTMETMPGKVLGYNDNKITIGTMDIIMLDDEDKDGIIMTYDIDDITDFYPKFTPDHCGDRYTIIIKGETRYLFFERNDEMVAARFCRWFVERVA